MKKSLIPLLASLVLAIVVLFTACKKETSLDSQEQEDTNFATLSSQTDTEASLVFDDVFDNVMGVSADVALGGTGVFGKAEDKPGDIAPEFRTTNDTIVRSCFKVITSRINPNEMFPLKVITDFGTGCTGPDGRTRKGKIITVYNGRLTLPGKVAETSFEGYQVNDILVQGQHRIENASTSGALVFKVSVRDGKLTRPNGNFTQWNSSTTITQTAGMATPLFARDDVFSTRSESAGTLKTDSAFFQWSSRTVEPLVKSFSCRWISKGTVAIRNSTKDVALIDYGNGDCDAKATLTINGVTTEITLH